MTTREQLFQQSYDGIKNQGRLGETEDGSCMYTTARGLHCGVGWVLTEEERNLPQFIENGEVAIIALPDRLEPFRSLLTDIQDMHDHSRNVDQFLKKMVEYAADHNIEIQR